MTTATAPGAGTDCFPLLVSELPPASPVPSRVAHLLERRRARREALLLDERIRTASPQESVDLVAARRAG